MKLAGSAIVAGAVSAGGASAADESVLDVTQEDGYEVWTVPEGETVVVTLDDGRTIENVLIDQTAQGANLYISGPNNPTNWTIRNVAWKGVGYVSDIDGWAGAFHMSISGDGVIENVFIDNRAPSGDRGDTYIGGVYLTPHHSGHIDVRNTFIAGCGNNAFYGSKPGDGGNGGTVSFSDCYHRDNTVSQFRFGTKGCRVQNSVAVVCDPDGRRGSYPGYSHSDDSGKNARLVWGRHCDDMVVEDCAFWQDVDDVRPDAAFMTKTESGSICSQNVLTVRNFQINDTIHDTRNGIESTRAGGTVDIGDYGYNPTTDVMIEGVPTDPVMAASGERTIPDVPEFSGSSSGGSDGGDGTTLDRTLTVDGTGTGWTDYEVTVSGDIENDPDNGSFGSGDSIDGSTATGFVNGGVDGYLFSGEVTDVTVDGDATILVDGEVYDTSSTDDPGPTVTTSDASDVSGSSAILNGSLDDLGGAASADVGFEWRETGATDWTTTDTESLTSTGSYTRELTGLSAGTDYEYRATAAASDGQNGAGSTVSFTTGDGSTLDRTLTVDGTGTGWTDYEFTVSGGLAENPDAGSLGTGDSIDGSTATGFVNGGVDGYLFSGEVTDITVDGDATILVDGQELDLSQFGAAPTIDRYEVMEAGSANPHANITVACDASDDDGDLSSLTVEVLDQSGTVVDSRSIDISGETAYEVAYFEVQDADGETFDVRAIVTDALGAEATATKTVQE